jgi:hypothetical protein
MLDKVASASWHGAPVWAWVAIVATLIFEWYKGRDGRPSNSTLEAIGNAASWAQSTLLGKFPPLALALWAVSLFRSKGTPTPPAPPVLRIMAFLPFALLSVGCAHGYDVAYQVKGDAAMLAGATADAFTEFSASHQLEIVAQDPAHAREALDAWRKDVRDPARDSIKGFFAAVAGLSEGLNAYKLAKNDAVLGDRVKAVYDAITSVASTYVRLKLPLPLPSLGGH